MTFMSDRSRTAETEEMWKQLVELFRLPKAHEHSQATEVLKKQFFSRKDALQIMNDALTHAINPFPGRASQLAALKLTKELPVEQRMYLLPGLVFLASSPNSPLQTVWEIVKSLPREQTIRELPGLVEPFLKKGDYGEYRCVIALYDKVAPEMARNLAFRAIGSNDSDIRDAGSEYLDANL